MSVYAQVRVITKEPKGREVNDGDSFSFNKAFSEKLYRIKINSIQLKETVEENKKTNDQVLQDRQYQVCPPPFNPQRTRLSVQTNAQTLLLKMIAIIITRKYNKDCGIMCVRDRRNYPPTFGIPMCRLVVSACAEKNFSFIL